MPALDPRVIKREGLRPITCGGCKTEVVAHANKDGTELYVNDRRTRVTSPRVGLRCTCGYITEWRQSRGGTKRPGKPAIPRQP